MNKTFEERAASARTAIDTAIDEVEAPPFSPRAAGRGIVVVAALLLAAAGGWLISRSADEPVSVDAADSTATAAEDGDPSTDGDLTDDVPTDPADLAVLDGPVLVFDVPVEGAEPLLVPSTVQIEGVPRFDVYGRADADFPFVDGDLVVARASGLGREDIETAGEPITIDGTELYYELEGSLHTLAWLDGEEGGIAGLLSVGFTKDELLDIAASWLATGEVDNRGLDLLAADFTPQVGGFGSGSVVYLDDTADGPGPVEIVPDVADGTVLLETLLEAGGRPEDLEEAWQARNAVDVIDHNGMAVSVRRTPDFTLELTFERDGRRIRVTAYGPGSGQPGIEELLTRIDSLRPATDAEIDEMARRGEELFDFDDDAETTLDDHNLERGPAGVVRYRTIVDDGTQWDLTWTSGPEATTCVITNSVERETTTNCLPVGGADEQWQISVAGQHAVAGIDTSEMELDELTGVTLTFTDGRTIEGTVDVDLAGDPIWFVTVTGDPVDTPVELELTFVGPDARIRLPDALGDQMAQRPVSRLSVVPLPPS